VFSNNKYLVTFLLTHLVTQWPRLLALLTSSCSHGCCVNNKQTVVFTKENKVLIKLLRQEQGYRAICHSFQTEIGRSS